MDNVKYLKNIKKHEYRGYTILEEENTTNIEHLQEKKPVWFFFTGYGGFWPGMGKDFMEIETFKKSILRSAEAMEPEGINLVDLILNSTKETYNDKTKTLVIIVSTQIALVDVYTSLGIKPDGIVGISTGELACAYADGCLTHEQTILAAYLRGKVLNETVVTPCYNAKISLSREEVVHLCPPDVFLACSYNNQCVVVAGPANSVRKFVDHLNRNQKEAKLLNSPLPFHTKYLSEAGIKLKNRLDKIIPDPKERSPKWLSTSVPESDWGTPAGKLCGGDYYGNSIMRPIFVNETIKHIPGNAITIQVNLDIRKWQEQSFRSMLPGHTGLHTNVNDFLRNVGKLHNAGSDLDIDKLYPVAN